MPKQVFAALYRAFEQVPQQILWKCAERRMPSPLPRNVKCVGWMPQLSVLCKYRFFFLFPREIKRRGREKLIREGHEKNALRVRAEEELLDKRSECRSDAADD